LSIEYFSFLIGQRGLAFGPGQRFGRVPDNEKWEMHNAQFSMADKIDPLSMDSPKQVERSSTQASGRLNMTLTLRMSHLSFQ
jgi:hypothetical protein